ncbi:hypothetical protein KGF56_000037 [Candida oxycetoniae]|uniref:Major facilitator superfamily (MFS) profile domain-containing protein n=1 Tax=Candida oxycetoniae TaxID=497107 RepID=A0AAI9X0J0_9ASCO|nr:uncharacterized protein KGF56_000037 [Candida oxycetoniae]KAI3407135.2 hypothetical protein KGF56_000037 [Candida oxycetoniae]
MARELTEDDPLLPATHSDEPSFGSNLVVDIQDQPLLHLEEAANDVYEAVIENEQEYDEDEHNEDVIWLREQRVLNKSTHWLKRPSVLMIATITFLLAFASSSAESTRQLLTLKLACNALGADKCTKESAQVLMSNLQLGYSISGAIIMLISSGKVAPLSDLYGRKIFIVAVVACFFVGRVSKLLVMSHFNSLQFYPMIACDVVSNLCGGIMALIALSNCYISDVVEPHQRIYSLGISIAAMFVGLSIGPLIGNAVISLTTRFNATVDIASHEFIPLRFEVVIILLDLLLAIFILPESRSEKARKKSRSISRSSSRSSFLGETTTTTTTTTNNNNNNNNNNNINNEQSSKFSTFLAQINFFKPLKLLYLPREFVSHANRQTIGRDRFAILVLVLIDCVMMTLALALGEIFVLFGIYSYNWNQSDLGQFLAITCSSKAVVLIVLSPIISHKVLQHGFGFKVFKKRFDMVDFSMCLLGLVCEVIGFFGFSLAPTTQVFFIFTVFCGFGSLISPSIGSAIIKFYPEAKIGEVFGAMSLLKNLFALVAPIFYLTIYKYSLSQWHRPGIVFIVTGSILFFCMLMLISVKQVLRLNKDSDIPSLSRNNINFDSEIEEPTSSQESQLPPPPPPPLLSSPEQMRRSSGQRSSFSDLHRNNSFIQKEQSG